MTPKSTLSLHTGNSIPILGLGTWGLTDDTPLTIAEALRLGYAMIDTSGDYGTQPGIAEGIKRSKVDREDIYIVTKVEETDNAYEAVRKNLEELQLAYADLVLIHRPPEIGMGEELWEGLVRARNEGLVRDIGVSNYSAERIDELIETTVEAPVVNQIEWSPFGHSEAMVSYAKDRGIVIQAYSPLTRAKRLDDPTLMNIASIYGKTPAQLLIKWNIQRGIIPIVKANQREHLEENLAVFDFEISDEDIEALNGLNESYSTLGTLPYV